MNPTTRFLLFGSVHHLDDAARVLADVLHLTFEKRVSGFRGGAYYRCVETSGFDEVVVQVNFADEDGCLAEEAFPDERVLVYFTQPVFVEPPEDLGNRGFVLLRCEEL